ncbi:hypothetical protein [Arthrobacter sp. AQ5-05]|uniref:hypothetical protein n=1 Tax=Arthrobacter sp. AQ5-05 TaxID=2184581 RepID=UPI0011BDF64D|nr:hypothetical protein [Arthrobacter sp. AQ5-05]
MYQPVDFATPQIHLAVAGIIAVFAIPMGIHALVRWRKFRKDPAQQQTYARRRDVGIESGVAALGIIAALVFTGMFGSGWKQSERNLVANIETRYVASDVVMTSWNGSAALADLVDANGVAATGIEVSFDAAGAPVLRDAAFALDPKHAEEHALDLRQG